MASARSAASEHCSCECAVDGPPPWHITGGSVDTSDGARWTARRRGTSPAAPSTPATGTRRDYLRRRRVQPHHGQRPQRGQRALLVRVRGGRPAAVAHHRRLRRHQRRVLAVITYGGGASSPIMASARSAASEHCSCECAVDGPPPWHITGGSVDTSDGYSP
ncbi:hypothetical protein ACJJTC_015488 [Scirpophaga incertulas]